MEHANQLEVISKLEPVDEDEEDESMELEPEDIKIINIYPDDASKIMQGEEIIENTDGHLQISTFSEAGATDDENATHVIITEDGTYRMQDGTTVFVEEADEYGEPVEYEDGDFEETVYAEDRFTLQEDQYEEEESHNEDNEDDIDDPDFDAGSQGSMEKPDEENPCTICHRTFKTTASLKRHITVNHSQDDENMVDDPLTFQLCECCGEPNDNAHVNGDIKCSLCPKLFVLESNLVRHLALEHPDENDIFKCCDCTRSFASKEGMAKHMMSHPLAKPYSCKACNRDFTRKYHLERHVQQTGCDGQPVRQFKCQVCAKGFSRKDNLRDHLRMHAGQIKKKKVFPCPYCAKEFQGSALLVVHLRTHTGERPYPCDMCPKRFPSSGAMKKHRRAHTGEKPYQCMECKRRFAAKETLNRHVRTHTGDKPHSCTYCGKSFIQAAQLRAHIFHHTGENAFTCPHCNRAFNRRVRLTTHIKFVHEGAEPMQCSLCPRTFYRREDLARHENLHSGEKPFACEACDKRFAVKASLKLHMLTHRKEQPCSCDECGRAFIRQDCLMRHMRAKHRDVLEDIMAGAEKRRLQEQLLDTCKKEIPDSEIWTELTLTDSIKELLSLLVDENTLNAFGWPDAPVDKILDSVIRRCGHEPASDEEFDYISRMRENAKLLFTVVIDDQAVKSLLNNQTVDEVIQHVLKLAKND